MLADEDVAKLLRRHAVDIQQFADQTRATFLELG